MRSNANRLSSSQLSKFVLLSVTSLMACGGMSTTGAPDGGGESAPGETRQDDAGGTNDAASDCEVFEDFDEPSVSSMDTWWEVEPGVELGVPFGDRRVAVLNAPPRTGIRYLTGGFGEPMSASAEVFFDSDPSDEALVIYAYCQEFGVRIAINGGNEALLNVQGFGLPVQRATFGSGQLTGRWIPITLTYSGPTKNADGTAFRVGFSVDGTEILTQAGLHGVCALSFQAAPQTVRLDNLRITGRCR